MITEDYVSFETAKLLKERGFNDIPVYTYYLSYGGFYLAPMAVTNKDLYAHGHIAAPTLQMVMKWLREVHNLHIMVDCIAAKNYKPTIQFTRNSKDIEVKSKTSKIGGYGFDSCEEACEAGIKYCLENLI